MLSSVMYHILRFAREIVDPGRFPGAARRRRKPTTIVAKPPPDDPRLAERKRLALEAALNMLAQRSAKKAKK